MTIYRLKLFTNFPDRRALCLKEGSIAIGWEVDNAVDAEDYLKKATERYGTDGKLSKGHKDSFDYLKKISENVKKGIDCYIWVQLDGLDYRLGKVTNDVITFDNKLGPKMECDLSEKRKIKFDEVPGKIIGCFVGRGIVLRIVGQVNVLEKYFEWLYLPKPRPKIHLENFTTLLHPDDLEDLAGLYLQEKEKYFIIPSTNKQGTKHIEYELRDINGNKACIQCKTGYSSVDTEKIYKEFEGYTIFVCVMDESQNGKYNNTEKKVEEIPFHKLVKWAKDHKNLLPQRIQNYIELTEN